jgi:putative DNA primase/helicase
MRIRDISPGLVEKMAIEHLGEPNWSLSHGGNLRFGSKGSLSVDLDNKTFYDFETDEGGGILDFLVFVEAAEDQSDAARVLFEFVEDHGDHAHIGATTEKRQRCTDSDKQAHARSLFSGAQGIANSIGSTYLRERKVALMPTAKKVVRFCDATPLNPYSSSGASRPAIIAAIIDEYGAFVGCQITYLRRDGADKAPIGTPRKIVGSASGHIPLKGGAIIAVAEGLETTLSLFSVAAREHTKRLGAAAALSAGGLKRFAWPSYARHLLIGVDIDKSRAGELAAKALRDRALAAGLRATLFYPPEGFGDWNDVAKAGELDNVEIRNG